jgi:ring-1,2-phenylacetyl-CoA epoxidase subunit PaaC
MNQEAVKDLLYRMADDALIIGHRNSEWTGIGPVLEEDIAFSSMSQDKIGHAHALYHILHTIFGEQDPDKLAFMRDEKDMKCCHLVEMPIGDFAYSVVRQFLFDHAEQLRYTMLAESSFQPVAQLAKKIKGEIKYHVLHGDTWVKHLSQGTEESKARMQTALNEIYPLAMGIFEEGDFDAELNTEGVFPGEAELKKVWMEKVNPRLEEAGLKIPEVKGDEGMGGRKGYHTEYLQPMLDEMTEAYRLDPAAEW